MSLNSLRISFLFNFYSKWIDGIVYWINDVKTLNYLEGKPNPTVVVYTNPLLEKYNYAIRYPFLVVMSWYADLKSMYYPQFFTKRKRIECNERFKLILNNVKDLVVSSQAVKDDFYNFFKIPSNLTIRSCRFAMIIEGLPEMSFETIRNRYQLDHHYFMISNQFHKHKYHKMVFENVGALKKKGIEVCIAIIGRFPNQPDSPYRQELHDSIKKYNLKQNSKFLGLVPGGDLLLLLKYAKAIFQPSLCDARSTVIEYEKSLQVLVIAANVDENIEQLVKKGTYFGSHNDGKLVAISEDYRNTDLSKQLKEGYYERMKNAA